VNRDIFFLKGHGMKNNPKQAALTLVVIGLLGMAAYPVILRFGHPAVMENDFFHGLWMGVCVGLELLGVYRLSKNKAGSAG
jgi:hypothetical protein